MTPNTDEIINAQQRSIRRLIDCREAQGIEIERLKAQLALRDTFRQGELGAMAKLQAQLDEARSACFNMTALANADCPKCATTDCGKGWRSPQEWDALQAACAELRSLLPRPAWDNRLEYVRCPFCGGDIGRDENGKENGHEASCRLIHALSADCGKDYIHKEQVKPLVEALTEFANNPLSQAMKDRAQQALAHAKQIGIE